MMRTTRCRAVYAGQFRVTKLLLNFIVVGLSVYVHPEVTEQVLQHQDLPDGVYDWIGSPQVADWSKFEISIFEGLSSTDAKAAWRAFFKKMSQTSYTWTDGFNRTKYISFPVVEADLDQPAATKEPEVLVCKANVLNLEAIKHSANHGSCTNLKVSPVATILGTALMMFKQAEAAMPSPWANATDYNKYFESQVVLLFFIFVGIISYIFYYERYAYIPVCLISILQPWCLLAWPIVWIYYQWSTVTPRVQAMVTGPNRWYWISSGTAIVGILVFLLTQFKPTPRVVINMDRRIPQARSKPRPFGRDARDEFEGTSRSVRLMALMSPLIAGISYIIFGNKVTEHFMRWWQDITQSVHSWPALTRLFVKLTEVGDENSDFSTVAATARASALPLLESFSRAEIPPPPTRADPDTYSRTNLLLDNSSYSKAVLERVARREVDNMPESDVLLYLHRRAAFDAAQTAAVEAETHITKEMLEARLLVCNIENHYDEDQRATIAGVRKLWKGGPTVPFSSKITRLWKGKTEADQTTSSSASPSTSTSRSPQSLKTKLCKSRDATLEFLKTNKIVIFSVVCCMLTIAVYFKLQDDQFFERVSESKQSKQKKNDLYDEEKALSAMVPEQYRERIVKMRDTVYEPDESLPRMKRGGSWQIQTVPRVRTTVSYRDDNGDVHNIFSLRGSAPHEEIRKKNRDEEYEGQNAREGYTSSERAELGIKPWKPSFRAAEAAQVVAQLNSETMAEYNVGRQVESGASARLTNGQIGAIGDWLVEVWQGNTQVCHGWPLGNAVMVPSHISGRVEFRRRGLISVGSADVEPVKTGTQNDEEYSVKIVPSTACYTRKGAIFSVPSIGQKVWLVTVENGVSNAPETGFVQRVSEDGLIETDTHTKVGDCGGAYVNEVGQVIGFHIGATNGTNLRNLFIGVPKVAPFLLSGSS